MVYISVTQYPNLLSHLLPFHIVRELVELPENCGHSKKKRKNTHILQLYKSGKKSLSLYFEKLNQLVKRYDAMVFFPIWVNRK